MIITFFQTSSNIHLFRPSMMDGRAEGGVMASKPTGANKRKGANPVRQIIGGGGGGETEGGGLAPLDLSLSEPHQGMSGTKKPVILSVPQYKLVTSSSLTSSSSPSVKTEPELTVTPVVTRPPGADLASVTQGQAWASLQSLLASQPQALFSLEQLKQASLIFQKHALNGNTPAGKRILNVTCVTRFTVNEVKPSLFVGGSTLFVS